MFALLIYVVRRPSGDLASSPIAPAVCSLPITTTTSIVLSYKAPDLSAALTCCPTMAYFVAKKSDVSVEINIVLSFPRIQKKKNCQITMGDPRKKPEDQEVAVTVHFST